MNKMPILVIGASVIGAALSQLDDEGRERPVAFQIKKFQDWQTRYRALDLELIGICCRTL